MSSLYGLVVPDSSGATAAATPLAGCADVIDGAGLPGLRSQIGPRAPGMGFTIF